MLTNDLFNTDYERRLNEGAVDQLEQRRIDDLNMKMDDLAKRVKTTAEERDNYYKVKTNEGSMKQWLWNEAERLDRDRFIANAGEYGMSDEEAAEWWDDINGVDESGIGQDLVTPQQRVQQSTPQKQTPVQKVGSTVKHAANWLAGKGGPGKEGPTYEGNEPALRRAPGQPAMPWPGPFKPYIENGRITGIMGPDGKKHLMSKSHVVGPIDNMIYLFQDPRWKAQLEKAKTQKQPTELDEQNSPVNTAKLVWAQIAKAVNSNVDVATITWPNGESQKLTRNQLWHIDQKARTMSRQARNQFALKTFVDVNNLMYYLGTLKAVKPRPQLRPEVDPSQPSLDLPKPTLEDSKKKDSLTTPGDLESDIAIKLARSRHPTAKSDLAALVKDKIATDKTVKKDIDQVKADNERQEKEIQSLEKETDALSIATTNASTPKHFDTDGDPTTPLPPSAGAFVPTASTPPPAATTTIPASPAWYPSPAPDTAKDTAVTPEPMSTKDKEITAPTGQETPVTKPPRVQYRQVPQPTRLSNRPSRAPSLPSPETPDTIPLDFGPGWEEVPSTNNKKSSEDDFNIINFDDELAKDAADAVIKKASGKTTKKQKSKATAESIDESQIDKIDIARQDIELMTDRQFYVAYGISKAAFQQQYRTLLKPAQSQDTPIKEDSAMKQHEWMKSMKQQYPGVTFAQNKKTMKLFAMAPGRGKVSTFDQKTTVNELDVADLVRPNQQSQTNTPPRKAYSIALEGKPNRDFRAADVWAALHAVFPNNYPLETSRTVGPSHEIVLKLINRGSAIVKSGINSEDIADSYVAKLSQFIPAQYWRIIGGDLEESVDDDDYESDEGDYVNDPTVHARVRQQPLPDSVLRAIERNPAMRADIIAAYKRKQGIAEGPDLINMSDLQFYKELLAVLVIPIAGLGAAAWHRAQNALKLYRAEDVINALNKKGITVDRATLGQIKPLLLKLEQAIDVDRDGDAAKELAQRIQQTVAWGKLKQAPVQPATPVQGRDEPGVTEDTVNPKFIIAQVTRLLATEARRMTNAPIAQLLAPLMKEYNLTLQQIDAMMPGGLRKAAGEYGIMMKEGWSDAAVARRTGRPRTPYSVFIKGKKWRDFADDDHAEAVANKLRAKFEKEGRDSSVITIAATGSVDEAQQWQGNQGADQAETTDHTMDEAIQYVKGNYPYHMKFRISRAEPGFRADLDPSQYNRSNAQVTDVDSAMDYLQLRENPVMSGSRQPTPSLGYSWHTNENRGTGIAVFYYEDRGMGWDEILVAAKDKNNLASAVQVFRDAGVIPTPKKKTAEAANPAQQAAIAIAKKKAHKKPKSVDESNFDQYQKQRNTPIKTSAEYIKQQSKAKPGDPVAPPFGTKIQDLKKKGVAEAQTDYQKRRQRERDVDAGRPVKSVPKNPQTDYAKKRAKEKRDLDLFGEEKTRLDPKCWTGKKIGNPKTKVKGGVRVNNCVPAEESYTGVMESQGITDPKLLEVARKIDLFAKTVK
jgi:hypothetical protein